MRALMLISALWVPPVAIDGDTLAVAPGAPHVRLDGIDAPELRQLCFDGEGRPWRCGLAAALALEAMITGRAVTCATQSHDRYGRDVAICATDAGELNAAMVREGWAVDYTRYSHGRYAAEEAEARAAKRGIWRGSFDRPETFRKKH